MAGQVVAELIRRPTKRGDSHWHVGHAHGQRLTFYVDLRANDDGQLVEV